MRSNDFGRGLLTAIFQVVLVSLLSYSVQAADWPTLRHDARRSGATKEQLDFSRLQQIWMHQPKSAPEPAWPGPARWDAYVKRPYISSMRNYDESFHVTVADGAVFYGSSADHAIHCLNLTNGSERWSFAVGGAVRHPPTINAGRLYFGSDDGRAYCVDIATQKLLWRSTPATEQLLIQDSQILSAAPIRTSTMVLDGNVYFAAGLLPWEKSYLCSLSAETGRVERAGQYVETLNDATPEGSILAAEDHLLVTQGRSSPLSAVRSTGRSRGLLPGSGGGTFAVIANDGTSLVGPGSREGFFSEANPARKSYIARKFGAQAMVASDGLLYVLERSTLGCFRQHNDEWVWRRPCHVNETLICAGNQIIVGGNGELAAFERRDGSCVWQATVTGRVQGLAAANGTLLASTDQGLIYAYRALEQSQPAEYQRPFLPRPVKLQEPSTPAQIPSMIRTGPLVSFPTAGEAVIRWTTAVPMPTVLVMGIEGVDRRIEEPIHKTDHEVCLQGLMRQTVYQYSIILTDEHEGTVVGPLECDTHFDFRFAPPAARADAIPRAKASGERQQFPQHGIGLLLGRDSLNLGKHLYQSTSLHLVQLAETAALAEEIRSNLQQSGILGVRYRVLEISDYTKFPITDHFADLVILPALPDAQRKQQLIDVYLRKTVPKLGMLLALKSPVAPDMKSSKPADYGTLYQGPELSGVGSWSHQYGRPDNATYADESLNEAGHVRDFHVQWLGSPGPRFQSDRGNRKPAPLYCNGRLFVQGLDRILVQNAYNGTVLWNLEIPDSRRFNIRNDSANWCADEESVFLAVRDHVMQLRAEDGELRQRYSVPNSNNEHWGYVGRQGNRLIGSAVPAGTAYQDFWGGQFWYTAPAGPLAAKVCSPRLFAYAVDSQQLAWEYRGGLIVNTSITMNGEQVLFVESRDSDLPAAGGRMSSPKLWNELYLVALSLQTGGKLWEQPLHVGNSSTMFSLAYGNNCIVAVASRQSDYAVVVCAAKNGQELWRTTFPWEAEGKGGDSARPVIIEDKLYISPKSFELQTGRELQLKLTRGACGSYAAAKNVFLTRLGSLGLWNPQTNQACTWNRLRPDCWLSAIPAGGMILAPEGGGGCSCGGWLETSISFAPHRNHKTDQK